jgi:hypothetical protein
MAMARNAIAGEWQYCPDGVTYALLLAEDGLKKTFLPIEQSAALFPELNLKWPNPKKKSNILLIYRTERRKMMHLELSPKSSTVIEFVNATKHDSLFAFLGKYGLPDTTMAPDGESDVVPLDIVLNLPDTTIAPDGESDVVPLDIVLNMRDRMRIMLDTYLIGDIAKTVEGFEELLPEFEIRPDLKIRPGTDDVELMLRCNSLAGFMMMELAAIVAGNAQVLTCLHCNNIFTAGAGGARKKTAHYCSNRCRVAAQRATAKAKQEKAGRNSTEKKGQES